jgi:hypothetical protein
MWCWRRIEKVSCTDGVRNEEVLHRVKEKRNILHTIKRRKENWIRHILRRNGLLKHVTKGGTVGTGRRGRRHKQLLDDLRETRMYWKLKEETLDCTLRRNDFGRGSGPVVRQEYVMIMMMMIMMMMMMMMVVVVVVVVIQLHVSA